MEGTHILFAKALLDVADVKDVSSYYAGAVYPDSRYHTKIPREKCHPKGVLLPEDFVGKSDFEKGLLTHAYYDEHSGEMLKELFGIGKIGTVDQSWIQVTAAKMVEEEYSLAALGDDIKIFEDLITPEAINGEEVDLLEEYYVFYRSFYRQGLERFEGFKDLFLTSVSQDVWSKLVQAAKSYREDEDISKEILGMYSRVLKTII